MKTQLEANSQQGELHRRVQATSLGVVAGEWPQCRQGGDGAGHPATAALPVGAYRAPAHDLALQTEASAQRGRTGGRNTPFARGEHQTPGAA